MNRQSGSAHVVLVSILVVALVGALGFIFWQNFIQKPSTEKQDLTADSASTKTTDTPKTTTPTAPEVKTGTIKGAAIYPSDGFPQDYRVCALNSTTKAEVVCDNSMTGPGKASYEISVTQGEYLIAAKSGNMVGYYDGYMQDKNYEKSGIDLCLAKYHTPLTVTVTPGSIASGIDAGNFYYTPLNC